MHLDGLIKIYVVSLLLAYCAGAGNLTKLELVGNIAKRELSSSLHMSVNNALYIAAVMIPYFSKEDPTKTVCSAFFIDKNWVATAASCFDGSKVKDRETVVIFGVDDYNVETRNEAGSVHVWLHPEYDATSLANDIALIKIRSSTVHLDKYKIVKLVDHTYYFGEQLPSCIALGYGKNIHNDTVLHYNIYEVSYHSNACGCNRIDTSSLCGKLQSVQEPCFTYKGGPLLCEGLVVGIASTANPCGTMVDDSLCSGQTYFRFTYLCVYFRWISKYVDNVPRQCSKWMSSTSAKAPLILHHLLYIIFIIIVCN